MNSQAKPGEDSKREITHWQAVYDGDIVAVCPFCEERPVVKLGREPGTSRETGICHRCGARLVIGGYATKPKDKDREEEA